MIRRALLFTGLVLLLGLATTVGVAWAFAGVDPRALFGDGDGWTSWSNQNGWVLRHNESPAHWSGMSYAGSWLGKAHASPEPPRWSMARGPVPAEAQFILEEARGWPWPSMRCAFVQDENFYRPPTDLVTGGVVIRPFVAPSPSRSSSVGFPSAWAAIPLTPICGGLAASTLLFAIAWLISIILAAAPASIRRSLRRSRGQCTRCGYARTGASGDRCPECGWDTSRRPPLLTTGHVVAAGILAGVVIAADLAWFTWLAARYEGIDPIHLAAARNDLAALERFIADGADVDAALDGPDAPLHLRGTTPLKWAAASGSLEALRALAAAGADLETSGGLDSCTPLTYAARLGNAETVRVLLELGARADAGGGVYLAPLASAASSGRIYIMRLLVEAGADVDRPVSHPPLAAALTSNQLDAARWLIERGATLSRSADDETLQWTVRPGFAEATGLVIALGADPNRHDRFGDRPLYTAIEAADRELVRVLLDGGADPNAPIGDTSLLHVAVRLRDAELVRLLLAAGVYPGIIEASRAATEAGATINPAEDPNAVEILRLLREATRTSESQ